MRTRIAAFVAAVSIAFGAAWVVGDNVDPIVDDEPATQPGGGLGHDHTEHTP